MKKIMRGIPVLFGYDYQNVLGRGEIIVHDDDSSTITISCPPSSLVLSEFLEENIPMGLVFVSKPIGSAED